MSQEKKAVILPLFGDTATAQPSSSSGAPAASHPRSGVVLVSGATGGVGKRVVQVSQTWNRKGSSLTSSYQRTLVPFQIVWLGSDSMMFHSVVPTTDVCMEP